MISFPYNSSLAKDSFKFLTKYLATFSGEDAYTMSEAKEEAVRAIVEFVKAPDTFQVSYSLNELKPLLAPVSLIVLLIVVIYSTFGL